MKPRIIYVHGNGAMHWSFAWAPWLKRELDPEVIAIPGGGHFVERSEMPEILEYITRAYG